MTKEERLVKAELEYVEKFERGQAPSLEELVEVYPDMREELVEFVLDYVSIESDADTSEPSEESLSAAAAARESALEKVLSEPGSLVDARKKCGERLSSLAVTVNVPEDTLRALEKGVIIAGNLPGKLLARLSEALRVSPECLYQLAETADAPVGAHNRAEEAPQETPKLTFEEALRKSPNLNEGHIHDWLTDDFGQEQ